jgi:hypothetical protein
MTKKIKITGIKKMIGEINRNPHMYYCVYLDRSTGEVWADFFADANSWSNYHDTAIVNLRNYIIPGDVISSVTEIYTNAAQRAMAAYND